MFWMKFFGRFFDGVWIFGSSYWFLLHNWPKVFDFDPQMITAKDHEDYKYKLLYWGWAFFKCIDVIGDLKIFKKNREFPRTEESTLLGNSQTIYFLESKKVILLLRRNFMPHFYLFLFTFFNNIWPIQIEFIFVFLIELIRTRIRSNVFLYDINLKYKKEKKVNLYFYKNNNEKNKRLLAHRRTRDLKLVG